MAHCELLLFPSAWGEPLSRVLLEGMACGAPILAMPTGGTPSAIADGVNGALEPTPAGFARRMAALLARPEQRAALGAAARRTAQQRYAKEWWCAGRGAVCVVEALKKCVLASTRNRQMIQRTITAIRRSTTCTRTPRIMAARTRPPDRHARRASHPPGARMPMARQRIQKDVVVMAANVNESALHPDGPASKPIASRTFASQSWLVHGRPAPTMLHESTRGPSRWRSPLALPGYATRCRDPPLARPRSAALHQ